YKQQKYIEKLIEDNQEKEEKRQIESSMEKRIERFEQIMLEHKVQSRLKRKAMELWEKKSINERMIKVGWFRKEEDKDKIDLFIQEYVDNNYEKYLKEELDIGNVLN